MGNKNTNIYRRYLRNNRNSWDTLFRKLNAFTENEAYGLPNILEIFEFLGASKYYSTLDLPSATDLPIELDTDAHTIYSNFPIWLYIVLIIK